MILRRTWRSRVCSPSGCIGCSAGAAFRRRAGGQVRCDASALRRPAIVSQCCDAASAGERDALFRRCIGEQAGLGFPCDSEGRGDGLWRLAFSSLFVCAGRVCRLRRTPPPARARRGSAAEAMRSIAAAGALFRPCRSAVCREAAARPACPVRDATRPAGRSRFALHLFAHAMPRRLRPPSSQRRRLPCSPSRSAAPARPIAAARPPFGRVARRVCSAIAA